MRLPRRPRLAEHALLRRHVVDGQLHAIVHDTSRDDAIPITDKQLRQILCCDGTRDLGGILLAASREGVLERSSDIEGLLTALHERGLLADGLPPRRPQSDDDGEQPLEVLAQFSLACEGHGSCCTTYSSVPFTQREAQLALALVPEAAEALTPERMFLPQRGSADHSLCAVTMVDGRCPFLGSDELCRIHASADAERKPRGCRLFPASFVDDGTAVRVSVRVECGCVLSSLSSNSGEPLVPPGARLERDLLRGSRVARLPPRIAIADKRSADRRALRAWSEALAEVAPSDAVAACWALADSVLRAGLDAEASVAALRDASPPDLEAIGPWLDELAATTRAKRESLEGWRLARDRTLRLSLWLDGAAQALLRPETATRRLASASPFGEHEAFYLRALLHGHLLATSNLTLELALRDRAIRALLARQCGQLVPEASKDDPSARYPLTAVETMMRGQGLAAYVQRLDAKARPAK